MPFTLRPDSWLILSGSTARRKGAAAAKSSDDQLSEFTSEKSSQVILVRGAPAAAGANKSNVTVPAKHIQHSIITLPPAVDVPARSHTSCRLNMVTSMPTRAALITFAAGTATGVLVMWFATAPLPSNAVSTKIAPEFAAPLPALPTSRTDSRPTAEVMRTDSAAASRPVATSGQHTAGPNKARRQSRAAPAPPARRRNASGAPASYRGSLAFRSAPQGARVFLNGALVGSTPLVLENLPVGSRAVRIEADGYQRWSTSTQVVANHETRVSATLAPAVQ